jgi:tetratricopeptide (TPR) repeat protein
MKKHSRTWTLILAVGVAVACPSLGFSQSAKEKSPHQKLFDQGRDYQRDGNYVEAERKFREALKMFPKDDQADRTAFYLVDTLIKLGRAADARVEVDNFRRNYPKSKWLEEIPEKILLLGGLPDPRTPAGIWNSPAEQREAQLRADLMLGIRTPLGPSSKPYGSNFPPNASHKAELLRQLIQMDKNEGVQMAKDLLKADPSDPAVAANLGTIANSESPLAVPFLLTVWTNAGTSPNIRNNALFWFARMNPDKEEVGKTIMDLLRKRETEMVASDALSKMTIADHRAVLDKIVASSAPDKFSLLDKIYRRGSPLLKGDLLMFVSRLSDPNAVKFIINAAENDPDDSVRQSATRALGNRKDVDIEVLKALIRSTPSTPPAPPKVTQPLKLLPGGSGSAPSPFYGSN